MIDFGWLVRSIHFLAATIWVGGSFIYLVVIIPAFLNHLFEMAIVPH